MRGSQEKSNKILCVLQQNLSSCDRTIKSQAYASLVRPIAEYARIAWSQHTTKDISAIESDPAYYLIAFQLPVEPYLPQKG